MKIKWAYRFSDGSWHDVYVCIKCGTPKPAHHCADICPTCATYTSLRNVERKLIKWIGIPFTPIGKFQVEKYKFR